jgi:hypothetical protein
VRHIALHVAECLTQKFARPNCRRQRTGWVWYAAPRPQTARGARADRGRASSPLSPSRQPRSAGAPPAAADPLGQSTAAVARRRRHTPSCSRLSTRRGSTRCPRRCATAPPARGTAGDRQPRSRRVGEHRAAARLWARLTVGRLTGTAVHSDRFYYSQGVNSSCRHGSIPDVV